MPWTRVVAASLAAFVAEGPLTGPAGGGFLLLRDAGREPTVLDCFFAVPSRPQGPMVEVRDRLRGRLDAGIPRRRIVGRRTRARGRAGRGARPPRKASVGGAVRAGARARPGGGRDDRPSASSARDPRPDPRVDGGGPPHLRLARSRGDGGDGSRARASCETTVRRRSPSSSPSSPPISRRTRVIERRPLEAAFCGMRVVTCPPPSMGGAVVVAGLAELNDRSTLPWRRSPLLSRPHCVRALRAGLRRVGQTRSADGDDPRLGDRR